MKKFLVFLFAVFLYAEDPKVCLNMIVKNESKVIKRCLESTKPLIDYWVIVDTGSTDGTQKIIQEFMKDIPGELHERPWVNFEQNRNEALELAKSKAEYTLFIDADDMFTYEPGFKRPKLDKDAYFIRIKYNDLIYDRTQLIRNEISWKWVGPVHEVLVHSDPVNAAHLDGMTMVIIGGGDRSRNPKKFLNDAKLLEEELKKNPNHARSVFYLAQSYRDAEMPEEAIKNYERRVAMGGWDQEVFWALYQIGLIKEDLGRSEEEVTNAYFKAFKFRPTRAEPLYRLCVYYRTRENHLLSYLLSKYAMEIERPTDVLFIESWIYDYGLELENSIASYWMKHYQESYEECIALLLKPLPQNIKECVERNIRFSIEKLALKEKNPG